MVYNSLIFNFLTPLHLGQESHRRCAGAHARLPWLDRIAAEDPHSVSGGVFAITTARREPDEEPTLFLRIKIKDAS
jgi:hypothetical protein